MFVSVQTQMQHKRNTKRNTKGECACVRVLAVGSLTQKCTLSVEHERHHV